MNNFIPSIVSPILVLWKSFIFFCNFEYNSGILFRTIDWKNYFHTMNDMIDVYCMCINIICNMYVRFPLNILYFKLGRFSNDAKCFFDYVPITYSLQSPLNNFNKLYIDYNQSIFRLNFLCIWYVEVSGSIWKMKHNFPVANKYRSKSSEFEFTPRKRSSSFYWSHFDYD